MTTLKTVSAWLKSHPVRQVQGMGSVQPQFAATAGVAPENPKLEFLLRKPATREYYVRWPNGSLRWESYDSLAARGFVAPDAPIIGDITEELA